MILSYSICHKNIRIFYTLVVYQVVTLSDVSTALRLSLYHKNHSMSYIMLVNLLTTQRNILRLQNICSIYDELLEPKNIKDIKLLLVKTAFPWFNYNI